ncbi:MAG: hypothetical protein ACFHVJ_15870 [Aestuariibacter sp.]
MKRSFLLFFLFTSIFSVANVQAAAWCTFDKVTNVYTGGNKNAICYMSLSKNGQGYPNIKICENADPDANNRNFSLAMAAMMSGKRVQIYSTEIGHCDEITKWFSKVDYLTMLAD